MQEPTINTIISEPRRTAWLMSLSVSGLVLLSCIGLWGYQYISASRQTELTTDISALDAQLTTISSDRSIVLAGILNSSTLRPPLPLASLVSAFERLATSSRVRLQGFSVRDDVISSSLIATADTTTGVDAVSTIIDMMRVTDPNTRLALEPIHTVVGTSLERTTPISLRILSTKTPTNAK